ncbi:MAG: Sua5/YciO/YrdC/YwlC family protein [Chromatiales bacterium]|jgi:L-threonylcarbamoyladenylate synthase|nr:Sua5/YciO/YrdC/YwlC family protein [Chromatiales bacterium]MDX9766687.1 Sua5/YciO/YrdC/YwlC family protein [Ectothiorhodospiraceae bacterium]
MRYITDIDKAAALLRMGGVLAWPTEAVWGLGCDPSNADALRRLLAIKRRPAEKGLILVAADFDQLAPWLLPLEDSVRTRVMQTWPGPHTWLWPARPEVSPLLRGAHDTLAVRVSAHALTAALCRAAGTALVSTSANPSDRPPAMSAASVSIELGSRLDGILAGELGGQAAPTRIRDARSGNIVRP